MNTRSYKSDWTCSLCKKKQHYAEEQYQRQGFVACRPCFDRFNVTNPKLEWELSLYVEAKPKCREACHECGRCDCHK